MPLDHHTRTERISLGVAVVLIAIAAWLAWGLVESQLRPVPAHQVEP